MRIESIKEAVNAVPFRPFALHVAHGRKVEVPNHDYILVTPTGRTVMIVDDQDRYNILDVPLITGIEVNK